MNKDCWLCGKITKTNRISLRMFFPEKGWVKTEQDFCSKCLKNIQENDENFRDIKVVK